MLAKVKSATIIGIDAYPIDVEVDSARGMPTFTTVGLPDNAVKESRERVRSAIKNSSYSFPAKRITVNLAPADIKKEGTTFDLPIALGLLITEGVILSKSSNCVASPKDKSDSNRDTHDISHHPDDFFILGELSLDGSLKPIKGALSVSVMAKKLNKKIILPLENAEEAALVEGVEIYGLSTLADVVEFFNGSKIFEPTTIDIEKYFKPLTSDHLGFEDVKGQEHVKRALEVATAGGHNVLMIGPPGSGKTMLAQRIPTILPEMTLEEAIEATKIASVAGIMHRVENATGTQALVTERPFRSPHHTVSDIGLIGGGTVPRPGEVSLSHNGVLFLDEIPEFKKSALEVLRQPIEDGRVTITRAISSITYPSSFMLICAMNPCPCGFLGDGKKDCTCTPQMVTRYRSKLSGPLLDRIDIHSEVPSVNFKELTDESRGEKSEVVRDRVNKARKVQSERFSGSKIYSNSEMSQRDIKKYCALEDDSKKLLETAIEKLSLSARAYNRILKVSRTIADLEGSQNITAEHIAEAVQYRSLDRHQV